MTDPKRPGRKRPDPDALRAARDRLVEATLPHVLFDGWTDAAIRAGARDCDMEPEEAAALLPGGVGDLIAAFSRLADRKMVEAVEAADLSEMRFRDRIAFAVETRLDILAPYREAVRRGLSWLAMPQNALLGAKLLYRTVDDVWYAVGDRSADFSFYTKRGLLSGVIASTTLFWLEDRSEDASETRAFLDRRISDVLRIGSVRRRAEDFRNRAPNPFRAVRDVVRSRYRTS